MSIKVVLAFANNLFSESLKKVLEEEQDISADALEPHSRYAFARLQSLDPDIVLIDLLTLYNDMPELARSNRRFNCILLDTDCGIEIMISSVLRKKIRGAISRRSSCELFKKAIRAVARKKTRGDNRMISLRSFFNRARRDGGVTALSGRNRSARTHQSNAR